jgi:hypothetical protein
MGIAALNPSYGTYFPLLKQLDMLQKICKSPIALNTH